jgi:hypothetical protein
MSQKAAKNSGGADQFALIAAAKPFTKPVEIPLPDAGWEVEEAWPAKGGLTAAISRNSIKLGLTCEFRAVVVVLVGRAAGRRAYTRTIMRPCDPAPARVFLKPDDRT